MTTGDNTFFAEVLANIGSWVEQTGTLYSYTSTGTTGTTAEAGNPQTITFGTTSVTPRVETVNAKDIEQSGGRYQADDKRFSIRSAFAKGDLISYASGTYSPIEGPVSFHLGTSLYWQAVCRKVQS
jgi:hypothetical protein